MAKCPLPTRSASYAVNLKSPFPVRRPTTRIAAKKLCNISVEIQSVVTMETAVAITFYLWAHNSLA